MKAICLNNPKTTLFLLLLLAWGWTVSPSFAQSETEAERAARMAWWQEARFGMFIHWGVYAVPAGTYQGKQIGGIGEWIMRRADIPVAEYRAFARQFNPVKYDPDAWVRLAREAGMKYIVITSKHHDGFALYDSKVTDWDIVDATPYGKDLLRPLEAACKKHGIKLGFYYSQAQDWTHPGGAKARLQEGEGWDEAHKGDFDQYLKTIAYPQVKEILSGYDIDILWWDTPYWMTKERAELLLPLIKLRPGLITNNRLGGGYKGDINTPEQHIPATGIPGRNWETCMTMNHTWGFKSYDHDWKSTEMLIRNLIDIASKGGNYLLNVGPTALGEIPQPSVERLKAIGAWMKINGPAIYGTTASPFAKLTWGRCTKKVHEDGASLYLHVFDWPADGKLLLPRLNNKVKKAYLLDGARNIKTQTSEDGVIVYVPDEPKDPIATVIVVEVEGQLNVEKVLPRQAADGSLTLPAELADIHNRFHGRHATLEGPAGKRNIGSWADTRSRVDWTFKIDKPGAFKVFGQIACPSENSQFTVKIGEQTLTATAPNTGDYKKYQKTALGEVVLDQPGKYTLSVKPHAENWKSINLRSITLKYQQK